MPSFKKLVNTQINFPVLSKSPVFLAILQKIVDNKDTVIVIEHNLDVLKTADYLIDMGPEGGKNGGMIVAEGTPTEVAQNPNSHTGEFLKNEIGL